LRSSATQGANSAPIAASGSGASGCASARTSPSACTRRAATRKRSPPRVRTCSTPGCSMSQSTIVARLPTGSCSAASPTSPPRVIRHTPNGLARRMQSLTMST